MKGTGVPAVFLHGFLGCAADFDAVRAKLECDTHAIDLPGHGTAPAPDPEDSFDTACGRVRTSIDSRIGAASACNLVGYSMGGRIALHLAHSEPHRYRTIAVAGAHPGLDDPAERSARCSLDAERAAALTADPIEFVDRWYEQPLFARLRGAACFGAVYGRRLEGDGAAMAQALLAFSTGRQPNLLATLRGDGPPLLYVTGALDAKYEALGAELARASARTHHVSLPGTGHSVPLEAPAAFAATLRTFWRRPEPRT